MRTKHGRMSTPRPARYAKQLASHWSGRGPVSEQDGATVMTWPTGQTILLRPVEGALEVTLHLTDDATSPARGGSGGGPADLDQFAGVVARHLEKFGQREELSVEWDDEAAPRDAREG